MSDDLLFDRVKASKRLPSPAGVAVRILELAQSDEASIDDVAQAISSDPALANRMLKFANSPSSGIGRRISTMDEAVKQIGLRGVQLMALSFSLVSSGTVGVCPSFDLERFWSRSLACAVAAKIFARAAGGIDANEAFIMGLLLHIGQLAMACGIPDAYESVLRAAWRRPQDLLAIEQEQLGATHLNAGARLLEDWRLPEGIWQTITRMHETGPSPTEGRIPPARVLYIADVTATLLCDSQEERSGKVQEIVGLVKEHFGIKEPAWSELYNQIVRDWQTYGQLLSVKTGPDRSFRDLQDEARERIAALSIATEREDLGIKKQNEQLQQRSRLDGLTGLANRVSFDERLAGEIERAQRVQRPLALCLLDIDHFKRFNDTYGHQMGDRVLQAVGQALGNTVRKMDLVARYGGEEFAVIAPECSPVNATGFAERLRAAVAELRLQGGGEEVRVATSIGVAFAQWPGREKTSGELIAEADARLYEAKRAGRNCCRFEGAVKQAA